MSHTLVLGVGNTLLTDEGAGVHAMRHLEVMRHWPDNVEFIDAGTLSFTLADSIASADNLVILDAAKLDAPAGQVRAFTGDAFDEFLKSGKRSVHEVGFADLMDIARLQDCLPDNRALIGIQPGELGWGDAPGPDVAAALPVAARLAAELIDAWTILPAREAVKQ
ncbi:MAG: HyaD/HybD family hydrogenase maturation endopeptidase [Gammaproteobacteria bacterium]|jgi:hydrogenase maturation protease|nr:HyaD/HybD family hydrogenase maturation endopeptidase [Gammaproteobacteria bacterium]MDH5346202.1 HyaD/HybD family hydrogenase maturation endopeptidase [Gammaproteobacteria bacterium]